MRTSVRLHLVTDTDFEPELCSLARLQIQTNWLQTLTLKPPASRPRCPCDPGDLQFISARSLTCGGGVCSSLQRSWLHLRRRGRVPPSGGGGVSALMGFASCPGELSLQSRGQSWPSWVFLEHLLGIGHDSRD